MHPPVICTPCLKRNVYFDTLMLSMVLRRHGIQPFAYLVGLSGVWVGVMFPYVHFVLGNTSATRACIPVPNCHIVQMVYCMDVKRAADDSNRDVKTNIPGFHQM